jgi:hypothetical protein
MKNYFLPLLLACCTLTVQAQGVDLSTSNFVVTAIDERLLQYSFDLTNAGTSSTQGYGLKLIFSSDNILDFNDQFSVVIPFQNDPAQFVGPNTTISIGGQYIATSPGMYLPDGSWFVFLEINYGREVIETNYANNITLGNGITIDPYDINFSNPPVISSVTENSFLINTLSEADITKIYYIVQSDGAPAPSKATMRNANEIYPWITETAITNLGPNIDYDVYFMGEFYNEFVTSIYKLDVKTTGVNEPSLSALFPNIEFTATNKNTESVPLKYVLKGFHLTADVNVSVSDKFVISKNNLDFSKSLIFAVSDFSSASGQTIYVKFIPDGEAGIYNGEVTHSSLNAQNEIVTLSAVSYNPTSNNFDGLSELNETGWTGINISGYHAWQLIDRENTSMGRTESSDKALRMDGSLNGNTLNEDWLITPMIDLSEFLYSPKLSFESYTSGTGAQLQLKYSTNYIGDGPPSDASWTDLDAKFPAANSQVWTTSSGIQLPKEENIYFAFVYTSTDAQASRWLIDNWRISDNVVDIPPFNLNFQNVVAGGVSDSKEISVHVAGYGPVTVTVSEGFEVSLDNINFSSTVTLSAEEAAAGKVVYVRFAPASAAENLPGSVSFSGQGLTITRSTLSGSTAITTGIDNPFEASLVFYPNPTAGTVHVNSAVLTTNQVQASVLIVNGLGAVVADLKIGIFELEALLSQLMQRAPSGIYFVIIQSGDIMVREKIIKE